MLHKALLEDYADFRLHHYVQSLEALLKYSDSESNREQFKKRCRPFTASGGNRGTVLAGIVRHQVSG